MHDTGTGEPIYIGIDPGSNTGFAVWRRSSNSFLEIVTTDFWGVIRKLAQYRDIYAKQHGWRIRVVIEATYLNPTIHADSLTKLIHGRNHTGSQVKLKSAGEHIQLVAKMAQDIGRNKRDAALIKSYCEDHKMEVVAVAPTAKSMTKLKADIFSRMTGYKQSTSEHGRDAAMLVWGK